MSAKGRHIGRNISRVRELLGVKQEALAFSIGISQQSISALEKNAEIDTKKLQQIAEALQISVAAIENFDERKLLAYFENLKQGESGVMAIGHSDLFKRLLEAFDANARLQAEKQQLYERLLETEQEKYRNLERLFHTKNN